MKTATKVVEKEPQIVRKKLKAALNLRFFHDLYALRNRLYAAP